MWSRGGIVNISPVFSFATVSLGTLIPSNQHACVTRCVYTNYYSEIGNALNCGSPYANDCYCNTALASASAASSWRDAYGSSVCSAGDLTDNLTSVFSIYASYGEPRHKSCVCIKIVNNYAYKIIIANIDILLIFECFQAYKGSIPIFYIYLNKPGASAVSSSVLPYTHSLPLV